jgi:DNA polymerase III subunit beta
VFKAMLQRTGYAASTDESRQVLNGALLSFKEGRLTIVATDGRRLALIEQEVEFPKEAEADMVLPSKTIAEMIRTIDGEGAMKIHATANQVAFESGKVVVVSKLVDGAYPNYRQVIPPQCEQRITIEREQFMSAVRRVALLTSDQSNSVKLTFAKNRVEVSAATPDVGEAKETIAVKYTGPDISVSFNPAFLLDPLKSLVADQVYFELNDEISPGVVKTDDPFLYVIMPMRMT